jgi:hypothetical protein
MYIQKNKSKENDSREVTHAVKQCFGFVDNRREAVAQRKSLEAIKKSQQVENNTAQIKQLKTFSRNGAPVQRFQYRTGDEYLASGNAEFVSQSTQISPWMAGYKTASHKKPNLKVATDNTLAIEKTEHQTKTFYSTQDVVVKSNASLESAGSPVRLMHIPGIITTDLSTLLYRTTWRFNDQQMPGASLGVHICNEVASKIAGGLGPPDAPLVLKDQTPDVGTSEQVTNLSYYSRSNGAISTTMAFDNAPTPSTIAKGLTESLATKRIRVLEKFKPLVESGKVEEDAIWYLVASNAVTAGTEENIYVAIQEEYDRTCVKVTEDALQKLIDKRYGTLKPEMLDQKSKILGVNQYAVPNVGEALATFPTGDVDHTQRHPEFQKQLQKFIAEKQVTLEEALQQFEGVKVEGWTWHFASAVAKSLDGHDYITLENYNRGPEQENEIKRVYAWVAKHLLDFQRYLISLGITAQEQESPEKVYEIMIPFLKNADPLLHQILSEAHSSFEKLKSMDKGTLWYFAMYGLAKEQVLQGHEVVEQDQSFHQAMRESGDFANPLTLKFRGEKTLEFERKNKAAIDKLTLVQQLSNQVDASMTSGEPRDSLIPVLEEAHTKLLESTILFSTLPSTEKKAGFEYVALMNDFYKSIKARFDNYN